MMTQEMITFLDRIEKAGRRCAAEAFAAGGPDPTDCDGNCLLPMRPQGGDWDELERMCPGASQVPNLDLIFRSAYQDQMEQMIAHKDDL